MALIVGRVNEGTGGGSGYSGYSGTGGTGASGYSGYNGTLGSSGFSGYSGVGTSGFSGYSATGTSGFSGYSGPSGFSGYSGPSGFSGYSGPSGFSGYSGISGFSGYSGPSGFSGYSGIRITWRGAWTIATDYVLQDAVSHNGASYLCTSTHFSSSLTEPLLGIGWAGVWDVLAAKGATGTSGFSGYSGTGASGFSGYSGPSGFSGYSGPSGFSGYSGPSGFSGYSGLSGFSGYSGPSGFSGYSGPSGFSGYSGPSGFSGYSGPSGFSGYSGPSGFSGYSGPSGFSGYSGISGFSGYSGISGFSGYSGPSGFSGYSGPSGFSGYSGPSGFSGYSGPSGYSGYSGRSGFSGYSGSGTSGFSGYSGSGSPTETTASQITSNQDDYGAHSSSTTLLNISADADGRKITGLTGGTGGREMRIRNKGTKEILFTHEGTGSTAANRLALPYGCDFVIRPKDVYTFEYSSDEGRWILVDGFEKFLSDPQYCFKLVDDFTGGSNSTSATVGELGWGFTGTGTTTRQTTNDAGRHGTITLNVSTAATTDRCMNFQTNLVSYPLSASDQVVWDAAIKLSNTSDGTQRFYIAIGLGAQVGTALTTIQGGGGGPLSYVGFEYDDSVSANWYNLCSSFNAGAASSTSSGIAADTNWHDFTFVCKVGVPLVTYYIDGASVGTQTTFMPDTSDTLSLGNFYLYKRIGNTARSVDIDYCSIFVIRTTKRALAGGSP